MQKLCILVPTLEAGGQEKVVSILCRYLDRDCFDVHLIVLLKSNAFFNIPNNTVTVYNINALRVAGSFFKLKKLLNKIKPDVILSTSTHVNIMMSIMSFVIFFKTKIVARESSIVSENNKNSKAPRLFDYLIKLFYPRLHKIICQSEKMKEDLILNYSISRSKCVVINNPIDTSDKPQPANLFEVDSSINNFITVGRFSSEKGYERILTLLSKIKCDFHYYIIGDGNMKNILVNIIENLNLTNKVTMLGRQEDVKSFLVKCDVYLFGSYYEGFPNAVLEAMQMGLPIIGFRGVGGQTEIINEPKLGFLNDDEIVLINLLTSFKKVDFDKKYIKNNVLERYDPYKVATLYKKVLS